MEQISYNLLSKEELSAASASYKPRSGVYFLWAGDEIVYIGQSINMEMRVNTHMTSASHIFRDIEITACTFVDCPREELDIIEALYIAKFKPRCNGGRRRRDNTV